MVKTALFPGSFDPFTEGHLNILTRALTMFDEVVVAVGVNQDKSGFFSTEQKLDITSKEWKKAPEIETIIIPTAQEFAHISSSAVRDILRHHGDTSLFVPEGVKLPPVK